MLFFWHALAEAKGDAGGPKGEAAKEGKQKEAPKEGEAKADTATEQAKKMLADQLIKKAAIKEADKEAAAKEEAAKAKKVAENKNAPPLHKSRMCCKICSSGLLTDILGRAETQAETQKANTAKKSEKVTAIRVYLNLLHVCFLLTLFCRQKPQWLRKRQLPLKKKKRRRS